MRYLALLLSLGLGAAEVDPPERAARLNLVQGEVSFREAGGSDWMEATVNRPLAGGDSLWVTGGGRAEMHVGSTAVRLGPGTAFQFLELDDRTVRIRLSEGRLTVRLRNLPAGQIFEISTPNLAAALIRPGDYRVDANPAMERTAVIVRGGEVEVTEDGRTYPVAARQQVTVTGGGRQLDLAPPEDDWDTWCAARDRREDAAASAKYVSREMPGYEDLDEYGDWISTVEYGYVWTPRVVVAGWTPYRFGHWVWIRPWGWTWIDDAPWGFAPFHYGRWGYVGARWVWIPSPRGVYPVYAPALVVWIEVGVGFGWFPLGPREVYMPPWRVSHRYFSRINVHNTVIHQTVINNYYEFNKNPKHAGADKIPYMHRDAGRGVTAVSRDVVARGERVAERAIEHRPANAVPLVSGPAVQPRREVRAGTPRPPEAAERRPLVTAQPRPARTPGPAATTPPAGRSSRTDPGAVRQPAPQVARPPAQERREPMPQVTRPRSEPRAQPQPQPRAPERAPQRAPDRGPKQDRSPKEP
jgi:hypothetical protein